MRRVPGLEERSPRLVGATGAAGDLRQNLERLFSRARIAMCETQIGIEHTDQRELLEMVPFGDELRADDEIVLAALDLAETILELAVRAHVRTQDHCTRIREALGHLLSHALDARPDRDQGVLGAALRTHPRSFLLMAAMMAHQHAAKAMLDQPRVTIGTLILMPARAAARQWRIAAAIEEQQRLLATIARREHFACHPRRDPLALLGRLLAHVERSDVGHAGLGEARGQHDVLVAALVGVVALLDGGSGLADV